MIVVCSWLLIWGCLTAEFVIEKSAVGTARVTAVSFSAPSGSCPCVGCNSEVTVGHNLDCACDKVGPGCPAGIRTTATGASMTVSGVATVSALDGAVSRAASGPAVVT